MKLFGNFFSGFLAAECLKIFEHFEPLIFLGFSQGNVWKFLTIFFSGFLAGECVKIFEHFIFGVSRGGMCRNF